FRGDISETATQQSLVDQVRREFGRLDLLVNNAGVAPKQRLELLETTEESFEELLAINLKAPFFLTQLAARFMVESKKKFDADYQPKIVIISSVSAYAASTNRGEYCISKAGLSMVTALFASALAQYGIGVFEIRPGIIATDMTSGVKGKYDAL